MATELVTFSSKNEKGDGKAFVAGDASSKIGLIMIHEWWGLNQQMKSQAEELAKKSGLMILVPDFYRGQEAEEHETAGHLMGGLDWNGAMQDITGSANYLKLKGCAKVGVFGFCMGGALALMSAAELQDDIGAASAFYGIPSSDKTDLTKINIPVQCHFGSKDTLVGFSSKQDYDALREKLTGAGVKLDFHEYDAGHAFCNPLNRIGDNFRADLADLAQTRLIAFMKENLQ